MSNFKGNKISKRLHHMHIATLCIFIHDIILTLFFFVFMRAVNMKYYAKKSSLYKLSDQNYNKKSKIWRMSSKKSKRTLNNPRPPRYADQLFFSNKMTKNANKCKLVHQNYKFSILQHFIFTFFFC